MLEKHMALLVAEVRHQGVKLFLGRRVQVEVGLFAGNILRHVLLLCERRTLSEQPSRGHPPRSAWARTALTTSDGIANPIPTLPALSWLWLGLNKTELMPITSPWRLINAPPELPGLIGASVWMKRRVSPCPSGRSVALTIPLVTAWPRPKGLPIATT